MLAYHNSIQAFAAAVAAEMERVGNDSRHGDLHLSISATLLNNGIKSCIVQVECAAGCGYSIHAYGQEAEVLQQDANAYRRLIEENSLLKDQPFFAYAARDIDG